ncbi:acyl-CoA oxidase [Haloferax namakaokahaiae]|uniref:Acyl-CoA oxidase n=1 Tax=Haloferax namakaokahaiae TaxID=1748331 RepID=A0ABD5ZC96_9EURY
MTDPMVIINVLMAFGGALGFLAYPVLRHFYEREVSDSTLAVLLLISLASVSLGAGVLNEGIDLVPVRALVAICLFGAQIVLLTNALAGEG